MISCLPFQAVCLPAAKDDISTSPASSAKTKRNKTMPNNVKHFAVHADDVDRARRFYESVLGWQFTPWGPPNFYLIRTGTDEDPGVQGALQGRRDVVPGKPMFGYECSIGVDSVDDTIAAVEANGGKIVMPKFHIPTVGTLIFFEDTEGNVVGAMQYEKEHSA
jgi:predicted enzyme related to lactoylglutathione lyase